MKPAYRAGWISFRLLFATYFHWRIQHPERVPLQGPVILAANHASFLDPPLVGACLRREVNYLARKSLFRFPLLGALLRSWNSIPVDRDGGGPAGVVNILRRLHETGAVLLFPEGTRTRNGQLQPARPGIGLIAIQSAAPVIPVRIFGTFEAFGRHLRWPRPGRITVVFGAPMTFEAALREAQTASKARLKEIYYQTANQIMSAIAALHAGDL